MSEVVNASVGGLRSIAERIQRAGVLVEALPYIRRFSGSTVVVKLGGSAIQAGDVASVLEDIILLQYVGMRPVIVHGGGPEITAWQARVGLQTTFVNGLRVTDEATMELVRMVLTGKVGPELVTTINRIGGGAIGLSGEDGPMIWARPHRDHRQLGYVGEIDHVDPSPVQAVLDGDRIPVIASIGLGDDDGASYNINADTAAAELSRSLGAAKLILLTDVEGVHDREGRLISSLDAAGARARILDGTIAGGMIPKVDAALRAVDGGAEAHVIDGRVQHALLLELLTEAGIGTMLCGTVGS